MFSGLSTAAFFAAGRRRFFTAGLLHGTSGGLRSPPRALSRAVWRRLGGEAVWRSETRRGGQRLPRVFGWLCRLAFAWFRFFGFVVIGFF